MTCKTRHAYDSQGNPSLKSEVGPISRSSIQDFRVYAQGAPGHSPCNALFRVMESFVSGRLLCFCFTLLCGLFTNFMLKHRCDWREGSLYDSKQSLVCLALTSFGEGDLSSLCPRGERVMLTLREEELSLVPRGGC